MNKKILFFSLLIISTSLCAMQNMTAQEILIKKLHLIQAKTTASEIAFTFLAISIGYNMYNSSGTNFQIENLANYNIACQLLPLGYCWWEFCMKFASLRKHSRQRHNDYEIIS